MNADQSTNGSRPDEDKLIKLSKAIAGESVSNQKVDDMKKVLLSQAPIATSAEKSLEEPQLRIPRIWRWAGGAAVLACSLFLLLSTFSTTESNAFAQMQLKLANLKTIQFFKTSFANNEKEPYHSVRFYIEEPNHFRMEETGLRNRVSVIDSANFSMMNIWPEQKQCNFHPIYDTAGISSLAKQYLDLLRLANLEDAEEIGIAVVEGRDAVEYMLPVSGLGEDFIARVFVDTQSNLPLKMECIYSDTEYSVYEDFLFDEPLAADLFEMKPPAEYTVNRQEAIDDTNLVLESGVGLGDIRFGMKKAEVREHMGRCDMEAPAGRWDDDDSNSDDANSELFYARGFRVAINEQHGVYKFVCGTMAEARPFQGVVKGGIRLGASPQDVESALGSDFQMTEDASMEYRSAEDVTTTFRFADQELYEVVLTKQLPVDD